LLQCTTHHPRETLPWSASSPRSASSRPICAPLTAARPLFCGVASMPRLAFDGWGRLASTSARAAAESALDRSHPVLSALAFVQLPGASARAKSVRAWSRGSGCGTISVVEIWTASRAGITRTGGAAGACKVIGGAAPMTWWSADGYAGLTFHTSVLHVDRVQQSRPRRHA